MLERVAELIHQAHNLVAFSGAGMSAESGIPTFRDPGGLWDRYDPDEFGSGDLMTSLLKGSGIPGGAGQFLREMVTCFERAFPNPGHRALWELEEMGILRSVITQNIDNLHIEAGNTKVIEVHGSVYRLACLSCRKKTRLDRENFIRLGKELCEAVEGMDLERVMGIVPKCPCGGFCRLDVVGFGEPVQDFPQAVYEAEHADIFLVLGTSGVVWPAASLPNDAKRAGASIIEINATECSFPQLDDYFILGKTGEVLPLIVEKVRQKKGQFF